MERFVGHRHAAPETITGMSILHAAALPFALRREDGVIDEQGITSTREELHGLLRLVGDQLTVQWRTTREISRVGPEIRTDREMEPIREVAIPLSGLASAQLRRVWRRWRRVDVLVLTAADLRAFDGLTEEDGVPGLVREHPAEVVLELRRADADLAREFVSELRLALAEHLLRLLDEGDAPPLLENRPMLLPEATEEAQQEKATQTADVRNEAKS